ncbi:MAG TPA: site-specific DNA-methyltransferase [Paludibacteraceae bacterium]|nr:site-specific DNA-methyltransferase [Paludibacteraceae bacterium]
MTALGIFELNNIYQGDCVELLNKIPDNSVDLIFADPPYNLQLNGDLYRPDLSKVDAVDDEWDKFDSFGEYDQFTNQWLAECHRVLKPTGSIWVIGSYHNIFRVGTALQNIGFWILNDIIWVKSNPMPNFKGTRFNNAHETLIWATKSKSSKFTFHYHSMKVMNDDLQMRSDWVIPICQGNERIKVNGMKAHSTQKPEELLYRVLISSSNPGDVVLDPFSGSGTTAAVAKRLGRRYIAFERDEFYIRVARERLEKITPVDGKITGYPIENRIPKVPFNSLIVEDYIRLGELLYSKDGKVSATVNADGTLLHDGFVGSIHKVSAKILNRSNNNGWSFWYVMRDNKLVSIDTLRYEYEKKYIKRIQHKL